MSQNKIMIQMRKELLKKTKMNHQTRKRDQVMTNKANHHLGLRGVR